MKADTAADRRRVFFTGGEEHFQVFSLSQNKNDGSIYFSVPVDFAEIDWLMPTLDESQQPISLSFKADDQGKLSLHGSGVTHVRAHDSTGKREFTIRGNALMSLGEGTLGVRHLLTLFLPRPQHLPSSPAFARKSDYSIHTQEFHPYVMVFWAVPAVKAITVAVQCAFHVDDLQEVPPHSGWGGFSMLTHSIVWFAYRTKHMEHWPLSAQACYHDGYHVPLFIGTGEGTFRLELRQPKFSLTGDELKIAM